MCTIVIADKGSIPDWISDLGSFRQWARSDEFPESGRYSFLDGEIWVDVSMEQLFSHNGVKVAVTYAIMALLQEIRTGKYVTDRMLLSNVAADLSTEPDGLVTSALRLTFCTVGLKTVLTASAVVVVRGAAATIRFCVASVDVRKLAKSL